MASKATRERGENEFHAAIHQATFRANSKGNGPNCFNHSGRESEYAARVQVAAPGLTERLLGGGAQVAATTSVIFVLTYFLLSAGDTFLRKLVTVIPTLKDKRRTVEIIRSIESDISFYLVMMLLINIGLGLGVAGITAFLGIPDPLLWGTLTAVLSFAPYVGELAIAVMLFVVSMVTFDTLGTSLIAPISYLFLMSSVHLSCRSSFGGGFC